MQKLAIAVGGALVVLLQGACSDNQSATAPKIVPNASAVADRRGAENDDRGDARVVSMLDACDGPSFMAHHISCTRPAGVTFDQFIAELTATGIARAWRFAPRHLRLDDDQTFSAVNRGGEAHTFTEVAHFGGGIVPSLNKLSGNPVPAKECMALKPTDFIQPGGMTMPHAADAKGTELYQCCIHPWMRTTVTVE